MFVKVYFFGYFFTFLFFRFKRIFALFFVFGKWE